jgi:hypothetical protein
MSRIAAIDGRYSLPRYRTLRGEDGLRPLIVAAAEAGRLGMVPKRAGGPAS